MGEFYIFFFRQKYYRYAVKIVLIRMGIIHFLRLGYFITAECLIN